MPDNAYKHMERLFARGVCHVRPPEARKQVIAMLANWLEEHYPEFDEATWYQDCGVNLG